MHANATKKVSRIKKSGAEISGTSLDPRKPMADVNKMNSRQLRSYMGNLSKFNARGTGYLGTADGVITRAQWNEYKRLESRYRKRAELYDAMNAAIKMPFADSTVGQRRKNMEADRLTAGGTSTNRPYDSKVNRQAKNINGPKALQQLVEQMKNKLKDGYLEKHVKAQRAQYNQLLEGIGDQALIEQSKQMTDAQFAIAWNELGLADAAVQRYAAKDIEIGRAGQTIDEDVNDDAKQIVSYATTLGNNGAALNAKDSAQVKNIRGGVALNKPIKR